MTRSPGDASLEHAIADHIAARRMLIVEDNDELRRSWIYYFTEQGWSVDATRSFGSALVLAERHKPLVIITELQLPDVRGYRFADVLRQHVPHPVKILAVTRMAALVFDHARSVGFDDVLAKPVSPDQLHERIQATLGL